MTSQNNVYNNFHLLASFKANGLIGVKKYKSTKTGLIVVIAQVEGPIVNGYFTLATEAFDDDGLPHTLEHLIFLGSEDYPYKGVLDLLANRMLAPGSNAWTDTDHTCYTVTNAGSEGFLSLMPVYLDHILYPTLTDSGYVTEVHHVNGEGKDAGVVYCEMQAKENNGDTKVLTELLRAIYPGKCGYKSNTGGALKNLRESTDNVKVRNYHKEFYRSDNLTLIITGQVEDEEVFKVLQPFEEKIISKGELSPFQRPWQSPVPEVTQSHDITVPFPCDEEDNGLVYIGWRGPSAVTEFYEMSACTMLLKYLTDTAISPLQKEFVEIDDPFASTVSFSLQENSISLLYLIFQNVPVDKLDLIKSRLDTNLKSIYDGKEPFSMKRMKTVIQRQKLETLTNLENQPHDSVAFLIIGDMLYGHSNEDLRQRLNPVTDLEKMIEEPEDFWKNLLKKYLIDGHSVTVKGKPSKEEQQKVEKEELERIAKQTENLGPDGLKQKEKELQDAIEKNDIPPPDEMLTQLPIPDTKKINFHSIKSFKTDSKESLKYNLEKAPLYMYLDDLKTNFVYIIVVINTESLSRELRPYLLLFLETILESPILRDGKIIPYEDIVGQLEEDTISVGTKIGLDYENRFICGSYSHNCCLAIQVEPEKYERGILWLKEILYNSVFTKDRLKIIANKIINDVAHCKRKGNKIVVDLIKGLCYDKDNNHYWINLLRQQKFLSKLVDKLENEESCQLVLSEIESVRKTLTSPSNMVVYMAANLGLLEEKIKSDIMLPWEKLLPENLQPVKSRFSIVPDWSLMKIYDFHPLLSPDDPLIAALYEAMGPKFSITQDFTLLKPKQDKCITGCIVGMGCVDSGFLWQSVPSISNYSDPDLPGLLVFLQYLTQLEGPMWKQIRGQGLSYGYGMFPRPNEGLLYLTFYRSTDVMASYIEAKNIVENHLKDDAQFDETLLDSAKSSMIFEIIEREKSIGDVVSQSLLSYFKNVDHDYNKNLVGKVSDVTIDDLKRIGKKYVASFFDPAQCKLSVVCHPTKVDSLAEGFKKFNFDLAIYKSLEETFLNEW